MNLKPILSSVRSRKLALTGMLFLVVAVAFIWQRWVRLNDPQGGASAFCDDLEGPRIVGEAGMVVSMHSTVCTTLGTDVGTYVHIHRDGQARDKDTLAFRFTPDWAEPFPSVVWTSSKSIRVSMVGMVPVSKQMSELGGIQVEYVTGSREK